MFTSFVVKSVVQSQQPVRRSRRNQPIIGIGGGTQNSDTSIRVFKAAPRRQWLYIGRVAPDTSCDMIVDYVKSALSIDDVKCELLASNEDTCSFKLGIRENVLKDLLKPELWPENIAIREFIPRRPNLANFRSSQAQ